MSELIPRAKGRPPWWVTTILGVSLFFLVLAIGGQIFFKNSVRSLNRESQSVKQSIADLKTPANQELERSLLVHQSQFANFNALLSGHYYASRVFDILESTIHPGVVYEGFSLDVSENRIRISALAPSYEIIGEQLLVLNRNSNLTRLETSNYSQNRDGLISFRLTLDFNPSVIK
jgi:hypothetical protein